MIYLIIVFSTLIFSYHYDICGNTKYRNQWYQAMLIVFVLLAGLRWRIGADTVNYLDSYYYEWPTLSHFSFKDYPFGKDPLFVLLNSVVKSLGGRFYVVQLIQATFVNGLIFHYFKKHSPYIFTCLFFYFLICYFGYNTEIMRGSMSIVICLYANDYFLERSWIKGYLLLLIAAFFHAQTIAIFFMPLLMFLRFNIKGLFVLVGAFMVGKIVDMLVLDYLIGLMGNEAVASKALFHASNNEISGMSVISILFYIVLPFIYIYLTIKNLKKNAPDNMLLRFEPFLMLYFVFFMVMSGFRLAHRYLEYYTIYVVIYYAYGFVTLARGRSLTKNLSYIRAFVIFMPIIWMFSQNFITKRNEDYKRYLPYSSVISRDINREREVYYSSSPATSADVNKY